MSGSIGPRICIVLARSSCGGLRRAASVALGQRPDLIEIRLDALGNALCRRELEWVGDLALPVIGTLRPSWEGGGYSGSEEERLGILQELADLFDMVDLEFRAARPDTVSALRRSGPRILVSHHDFHATPGWQRLIYLYGAAKAKGGDAVKIATRVRSVSDLVRLLSLHECSKDLVVVPMGKEGRIGRVLAPIFGSLFAYASMNGVPPVAPGMMAIGEVREMLEGLSELAPGEDPW